MLRELLPWRLT